MNARMKNYLERNVERNKRYGQFVKRVSPLQSLPLSLTKAFLVGGTLCLFGQAIADLAKLIWPNLNEDLPGAIAGFVIIFLTCLFTGLGLFDKLAKVGGGGTFLPISGFANSISSAAMESRTEGLIFGLASKFFSIAGAVIVNGVAASAVVGLIYWILLLCGVNI